LVCDYESSGGEEEEPKKHVAMKAMSTTPEDEEPDKEEEPEDDLPALPFLLADPPKKKEEVAIITLDDMVSPTQSSRGKCDFVYFQIDDGFALPAPSSPETQVATDCLMQFLDQPDPAPLEEQPVPSTSSVSRHSDLFTLVQCL
jgi:hypothetical protein